MKNDLQRALGGEHVNNPLTAAPGQNPLDALIASALVLAEDVDKLPPAQRQELDDCPNSEALLTALVERGLLTDYQRGRIEAGTIFGLVLGNYRVLDRLGAGGMGVVFRAEHITMRKLAAIKVLPLGPAQNPRILHRFMTEIRAVGRLQHPNIVGAFDAGALADNHGGTLHFFVMEYVPGQDLESLVRSRGPLLASEACDLMHQIASALAEAQKHDLVHRDIKPSNIQVTPEGQAKLLDFGLARIYTTGVTEQGVVLGTVDFMAPEQVADPRAVDIRADLYGLGGVLYWCLTGTPPFPSQGRQLEDLVARLRQQPPTVRDKRPDVPLELERLIQKLMALDANDRYASPQLVMRALLPFIQASMDESEMIAPAAGQVDAQTMRLARTVCEAQPPRTHQVLLVDDELDIRSFCKHVLQAGSMACDEAAGGKEALRMARAKNYDLLIVDVQLPDLNGNEVCRALRDVPPCANLKIIMASGYANTDMMAQMLQHGADDFITKPFSVAQLQSRVKAALTHKDAQDYAALLKQKLLGAYHELEKSASARDHDLAESRNALVLALANLVKDRANETGAHPVRLQKYIRTLGEECSRVSPFAAQMDDRWVELAASSAALRDIGKIGLPDHILMKPTKLDAEERLLMQTHTTVGADMLRKVADSYPSASAFLQMAVSIARHHHERFDGSGYPDGLAGDAIPLAAHLVCHCEVYDALRSRRAYKPSVAHQTAMGIMAEAAGSQFNPALFTVFRRCADQFQSIFLETPA